MAPVLIPVRGIFAKAHSIMFLSVLTAALSIHGAKVNIGGGRGRIRTICGGGARCRQVGAATDRVPSSHHPVRKCNPYSVHFAQNTTEQSDSSAVSN
ncbi:uncharacterized protein P884DRAFT_259393 [Thermothelomyces heterothallicus CBS 202.75]|uniref:uncharacterized protein n=1 Tax=Thermothelomyces heterothallicus CBS 202.75 TaxID=1149848 RepID=UPI0037424B1E